MAVYATQDDVLARAGRFAGLFSVAGRRPNLADIDAMLVTVSAEVDAEIRAHGYDPATITPELVEALTEPVAWAVLIRALPGASPGDDAIEPLIERGRNVVTASGFPALADVGVNVMQQLERAGAIELLEAGGGGGGPGTSAGSFWDELPEEWIQGRLWRRGDVTLVNGALPDDELEGIDAAPVFRRGMSL